MDVRKNAVDLSDDEQQAVLEAFIKLKARQAPGAPAGTSVYDQFVALHGAVMAVLSPGVADPINFAHGNIGFLPWHRQYLRVLELALQQEVAGVTLPYWRWSDDISAATRLFTPDFLSTTSWGAPTAVSNGVLRRQVPSGDRPAWWPAGLGGFAVHSLLEEGSGTALSRGSTEMRWPPAASSIDSLAEMDMSVRGTNALWAFWLVLEAGHPAITTRTHNAGHRFIGGHMGGAFSPNDPIFWLHHANVDRIWAHWQQKRIADVPGATHDQHWPAPNELSPFTLRQAPLGHRLNDVMWPWVGNAAGYRTVSVSAAVVNRLPDFSADPAATVSQVLDFEAMGFEYADPV